MICWMTKIILPLLIITLNISCSGPSLEEYLPKVQEEKKIISLLIQYQDAKINCNLDQFLACLHENGVFHFGRGFMLSKNELKESLPSFWAGLKSGSREFYPMNREMITGNYNGFNWRISGFHHWLSCYVINTIIDFFCMVIVI